MRIVGYSVLFFLSCVSACWADDNSWEKHKEKTISELPGIRGWCSKQKAAALMDFVLQQQPKVCVEIGTFGGSTTYPLARALMYTNQGVLYAIDAWDNMAAIEGLDQGLTCIPYWSTINMQETHDQFMKLLSEKGLGTTCHPIRMRSEKAVDKFANESIDFLFIDGNFSSVGALLDVVLYLPKVKKSGYIWLTDPMTPSKNKAVALLMKNCTWVKKLSSLPEWIVFKKEPEIAHSMEKLTP